MIKLKSKLDCCGCSACVQICPKNCLQMREDKDGFLYPQASQDRCVDCHLCEKVCPVLNQDKDSKPLFVYAAKSKDDRTRLSSSSGGVFSVLAENVLKKSGVVFGASFNDRWEVEHRYIEDVKDLDFLRRSKYVESDVRDCYIEAKRFLQQGRKVLFTGTPCQIAGLRKYLGKEYDNLVCVDVVCHGVPSPRVWREYLSFLRRPKGADVGKNTVSFSSQKEMPVITGISFRDKSTGWKKFGFNVLIATEGSNQNSVSRPLNIYKNILIKQTFDKNIFMRGFLKNLYLRESCYHCPVKCGKSHSDITLADFWGIDKTHPDFDDNAGVSVVMLNTDRGINEFKNVSCSFILLESNYEEVKKYNTSIVKSSKPHEMREYFFYKLEKARNIEHLVDKCLNYEMDVIFRIKKKLRII